MAYKALVILIVAFVGIQSVEASLCPEPATGTYPGWALRGCYSMDAGDNVYFGDFRVNLYKKSGDVATLYVYLDGVEYFKQALIPGDEYRRSDMIVVYKESSKELCFYTPQKANFNLSWKLTSPVEDAWDYDFRNNRVTRVYVLPGQSFTLNLRGVNVGELGAEDLKVNMEAGVFELEDTPQVPLFICQGSSDDLGYTLKTPPDTAGKDYTLYLRAEYRDYNQQLNRNNYYVKRFPINITVIKPEVEINKSVRYSGLSNNILFKTTIKNNGSLDAYNVYWNDTRIPGLDVISGKTSYKGFLESGKELNLYYQVDADEPLYCKYRSRVSYNDRYGNTYETLSKTVSFKVAPLIEVRKVVDGSFEIVTTSEDELKIKGNEEDRRLEGKFPVKITVKNKGSVVARDISIKEDLGKAKLVKGDLSWRGDIEPGEEVTVRYTAEAKESGNQNIITEVSYSGLAPTTPKGPSGAGYSCVRKLEKRTLKIDEKFYGVAPKIKVSQPEEMRVAGGGELLLKIDVENVGSDFVYDLKLDLDLKDIERLGGGLVDIEPGFIYGEMRPKYLPEGSETDWKRTGVTYRAKIRTPEVIDDKDAVAYSRITYRDSKGEVGKVTEYTKLIVQAPRLNETLVIPKTTPPSVKMGEEMPVNLTVNSKNYTGFYNFTVHLPAGVKLKTSEKVKGNSSEVDGELYYTGNVSFNGSVFRNERNNHLFKLYSKRVASGKIPVDLYFEKKHRKSYINYNFKGPVLKVVKSFDASRVDPGVPVNATIEITNVGEGTAYDISVKDRVPENFTVTGETQKSQAELAPGGKMILKYSISTQKRGNFEMEKAKTVWRDGINNTYTALSQGFWIISTKKEVTVNRTGNITGGGPLITADIKQALKKIAIAGAVLFVAALFLLARVNTPVLKIKKEVLGDTYRFNPGEPVKIRVMAENVGKNVAYDIVLEDKIPIEFEATGGDREDSLWGVERLRRPNLNPGEKVEMKYEIKTDKTGFFTLHGATVTWHDSHRNSFKENSKRNRIYIKRA